MAGAQETKDCGIGPQLLVSGTQWLGPRNAVTDVQESMVGGEETTGWGRGNQHDWGPRNEWLASRKSMAGTQAINGRCTGHHVLGPRKEIVRVQKMNGSCPGTNSLVSRSLNGWGAGTKWLSSRKSMVWGPGNQWLVPGNQWLVPRKPMVAVHEIDGWGTGIQLLGSRKSMAGAQETKGSCPVN